MTHVASYGLVFFLLFLSFFVSPYIQPVAAQFDPVGEILRPAGTNSFRAVAEKDGYVYVGNSGGKFYVFDARSVNIDGPFRTINSPVSERDLRALGMLRVDSHLYVASDGLLVMDITNPAAPVSGIKMEGGSPQHLNRDGDFLFATGKDTLNVYSITNRSNPAVVSNTATLGGDNGFSIAGYGEYIYVGAFRSGQGFLRVFAWPQKGATVLPIREIAVDDVPYHLIVKGDYLVATNGNDAGVWSLANPEFPVQVNEQIAGGRTAVLWGNRLITNGRVFSCHGPMLDLFSSFTPGGSQGDGLPYFAAANADFVFLPQSARILILAAPPTLVFPQYINGLSGATINRTRIVLKNTGDETANGVARFRTTAGAPNPVPIGGTSKSEETYSIPAGGTQQVVTDGTGGLTNGPLEVRSNTMADAKIKGTVMFSLLGHDVSAQAAPLATVHLVFASRASGEDTGVAVYNPNFNTTSELEAHLFDKNGAQVAGPVILTVGPRAQRAVFISEAPLFQTYLSGLGGFEGTLKLTARAGRPVAVMSFIQKSNGALLAVPVESQGPPGE